MEDLSQLIPAIIPNEDADPELISIGERYWALAGFADDEGTPVWCEKTKDIDTAGWGRQIYAVAAAGVRAVVPGRTCTKCSGPLSLTSRTAFQQVCYGQDPVCVQCTDSLLAAIRIVLDPARKAKRDQAKAAAETRQVTDRARASWRQSQREIVEETYPADFPSQVRTPPTAPVRDMLGTLALLRYAPTTSPITQVSTWPDPLHPNSSRVASLLGSLVRAGLVSIHPSSPVTAFVWEPETFEEALSEAGGDLGAVGPPRLTGSFYPLSACYYAPHGTSAGTAAEQLDAHLTTALDPAGMTAARQNDLLALAGELIAEEALRYFTNRLEDLHLPAVPDNHTARLSDAVYKLAEHRPLGEIYNLVWRATRAAAEAAQKNPRAPRAHMSTHAVNQLESHAQQAASDPDWQLKAFGEIKGHGPAAMTRTLFFSILDSNPLTTSLQQIADGLPEPAVETVPDPNSESAAEERDKGPGVPPDEDDELAVLVAWLNAYPDSWSPEAVSNALAAVRDEADTTRPDWQFEGKILARGAAQLQLLYTRLAPTLGSRPAALAVIGATALLGHPVTLKDQTITNGAWLQRLLSNILLGLPDEDEDAEEDGSVDPDGYSEQS
jgi:hypothetical protein